MVRGHERRERNTWERFAWLAAHLINISGKRARHHVRPKELLGQGSRNDPIAQHMKMEQIREKLEKRKQNGDSR